MENVNFCQSCSMPLTSSVLMGTEKDGSLSAEYCKYCYQHGEFENPEMTLEEMRKLVIDKMDKQNIPEDIIETSVSRLPDLKRWVRNPSLTLST